MNTKRLQHQSSRRKTETKFLVLYLYIDLHQFMFLNDTNQAFKGIPSPVLLFFNNYA